MRSESKLVTACSPKLSDHDHVTRHSQCSCVFLCIISCSASLHAASVMRQQEKKVFIKVKEKVRPSWYILNVVYDTNNGLIVDGFIFNLNLKLNHDGLVN